MCFDNVRVVVPCGDGTLLVRDLMHEAILRYKKATGKSDSALTISSLSSLTGGGLLDPDDRLCDVADDREQIVAHFLYDVLHAGDGASSVGTNSPDFHPDKDHRFCIDQNIKRETKRLSMHVLSTREPCFTTYTQSLPRESRRKEPLGQDAKSYENLPPSSEIREIVIKNEAGPLGLHVVPCYDLSGNDQGLRVEVIEPNGRIAKDGQIELHDNIIKINGHNLLRMPFSKVQEIFRTCMNEPSLQISVLKKTEKSLNLSAEKEDGKRLQNYKIQTANTRKIGKMIEIELTKGGHGLGFSVTTRDNPAGGHCPIYIKNILPKGAAVEDGRLKPGDRLLEVNKMEMTGKSQDEVVALLRSISPGGKVKLLVSRQEEIGEQIVADDTRNWKRSPKKSDEDKFSFKAVHVSESRKNRMVLTLDIPVHDSEKAGLGVSVKGKTSSSEDNNVDLGIFIKSVLHGGAASRDGRLRNNDQLLNVNGVSLLGLSNSDAMETLRRAMLNTNSPITGVITLTIARRVSYEDKNYLEKPCKLESNSYLDSKLERVKDVNQDLEKGPLPSPWNPVIDRLTEQYNKNSLRNESYCIATNKAWIDSTSSLNKKLSSGQNLESVLVEDDVKISEDKDSQYSGDPTYDSQLSLEEFNSSNKFSRDALGRQSMSEKRHAALDAKNTDTYKRNKKLRESREKSSENSNSEAEAGKRYKELYKELNKVVVGESSSFDSNRKYDKVEQPEYLYTIPGCINKISPRKHWLVDDVQGDIPNSNNFKEERESNSFSNRGDVKQASLNSALDDRYKRSRKKGGIRSMLRLGKNRKSLNFGDNIENRHESNNYCSGTINYIA